MIEPRIREDEWFTRRGGRLSIWFCAAWEDPDGRCFYFSYAGSGSKFWRKLIRSLLGKAEVVAA